MTTSNPPTTPPQLVPGAGLVPGGTLRSAALWSLVLSGGRRVTTTLVTFVLAGLLGPRDFGTVAVATIIVLLLQLLFQQGFMPALVQTAQLDDEASNAVFRVIAFGSLGMVLGAWTLSPLASAAFNDSRLTVVIRALALLLPLQAAGLVQEAHLRRAMAFRPLAVRTNLAVLLGGAAGIVLAVGGAGVWALVVQQLLTGAVSTVLVWRASPWRPRLHLPRWWDRPAVRPLLRFAGGASLAATIQFLGSQVDSLLVGAFFGLAAVGVYRLASRLVETVLDLSLRALQPALLADLARVVNDRDLLAQRVLRVQRLCCTAGLPLLGLLAGFAPVIVRSLGPRWHGAALAVILLASAGLGTVVVAVVTPALQAVARPALLAKLSLVNTLLVATGVTGTCALARGFTSPQQVDLVALSRIPLGLATVILSLAVLRWATDIRAIAILRASAPGLVTAFAVTSAMLLTESLFAGVHVWILFISVGSVGVLTGVLAVLLMDRASLTVLVGRGRAARADGRVQHG